MAHGQVDGVSRQPALHERAVGANTIVGRLVDAETRLGIAPRVEYFRLRREPSNAESELLATGDETGAFSLESLDSAAGASRTVLSIAVPGYVLEKVVVRDEVADVGQRLLYKARTIAIRVRTESGDPVPDQSVRITSFSPYSDRTLMTDGSGCTAAVTLRRVTHFLTLGDRYIVSPIPCEVPPTSDGMFDVVVVDPRIQRSIVGRVVDELGEPQRGAQVIAQYRDSAGMMWRTCGQAPVADNGLFTIMETCQSPDIVSVLVTGAGGTWPEQDYEPKSRIQEVAWQERSFVLRVRRLVANCSLEIEVVGAASKVPVSEYGVRLFQNKWSSLAPALGGRDVRHRGVHPHGILRMTDLKEGSYCLAIVPDSKQWIESGLSLVELKPGAAARVQVALHGDEMIPIRFEGSEGGTLPRSLALASVERDFRGKAPDQMVVAGSHRFFEQDFSGLHNRVLRIVREQPVVGDRSQMAIPASRDFVLLAEFESGWKEVGAACIHGQGREARVIRLPLPSEVLEVYR